ncbi:nicotinamide riboside transporter PnuC [Gayadomonas joobiniege]|uniref:nicotinamide riboside transporter PnuC n=1 Tax=Gayadomonas joobiniege TaxID=1234606 RepID=UPI000367C18C|nr:nicotinamide riboside transporter PnuC [Gayadomonas joobiniege]
MNSLLNELNNMTVLEITAVIFSLVYVFFAAKGKLACWPAAIVSSSIYCYIFWDVRLLMDSLLQVYYVAIAIYGWINWSSHRNSQDQLAISSRSLKSHLSACAFLLMTSLAIGFILASNTDASYPYLDSVTTLFAFYATFLAATRVLENWLYWLVIDSVSIYLYVNKGLELTALLFLFYSLFAAWGYFNWRNQYDKDIAKSLG